MTKKIPIILDTDPGIDDAAAIVIAATHPSFDLKLVTTAMGNVDVEKTTQNALKLLEFVEVKVPVAKGSSQPLLRKYVGAPEVHGASGLADYVFPEPVSQPVKAFAVEAMRDLLLENEEPITLVPIGALTNIALLLHQYPEVKSHIKEIVLMGGSFGLGNRNSVAEFNIFADPHAAQMVFQSGVSITMIGLNVTHQALVSPESVKAIASMNKVGAMLTQLFKGYLSTEGTMTTGLAIHDACALYYVLHRDRVESKSFPVEVILDGPGAGATVVDMLSETRDGNVNVALSFDVDHFNQWFVESIKGTVDK